MNPYSVLISYAGLSHREASDFHKVRLDTVKSWSSGRNHVPEGAIDELIDLINMQDQIANSALLRIYVLATENGTPETIELGYPADDHEAQTLGWPCVGAWRAMAARVIAKSTHPVRLVPRGSTPATAAAIDEREG
jgi:hypothetical protein